MTEASGVCSNARCKMNSQIEFGKMKDVSVDKYINTTHIGWLQVNVYSAIQQGFSFFFKSVLVVNRNLH